MCSNVLKSLNKSLFRRVCINSFYSLKHSKRMASRLTVRSVEGEDRLQICLKFGFESGKEKVFNLDRLQEEEVGKSLIRLQTNIVSKLLKRKNKKKPKHDKGDQTASVTTEQSEEPVVNIGLFKDDVKLEDCVLNKKAWLEASVLKIEEQEIPIVVNPPCVTNLKLNQCFMAGFPIFARFDLEFADLDACECAWFVCPSNGCPTENLPPSPLPNTAKTTQAPSPLPNTSETTEAPSPLPNTAETTETISGDQKKPKPEGLPNKEWMEVCRDRIFTPDTSHIGSYVKLSITPKNNTSNGEIQSVESTVVIGAGPGTCPFEERSTHTKELSPPYSIRVVSYNLLADLYADSDFSRNTLYPYCPPYALHIDYRKQLFIKELHGYNADLICLQEVDRKVFVNDIKPSLSIVGFDAVHRTKAGEVNEGMATCFRTAKLRLLGQHDICLAEELQSNPDLNSLNNSISANQSLSDKIYGKTTVLQVSVLESLDQPGEVICVGNTHLYFHPRANHVRLIQVITCMKHLEGIVSQYQSQAKRVSLLFCGDFNSSPQFGVNEFMTTSQIPSDHQDWASGGEEDAMSLTEGFGHRFTMESGCGYPQYTNFVGGFCGTLDYIYVDVSSFDVKFAVPNPKDEDVTQYTALPSIVFPSDHIAQICEVKFR